MTIAAGKAGQRAAGEDDDGTTFAEWVQPQLKWCTCAFVDMLIQDQGGAWWPL